MNLPGNGPNLGSGKIIKKGRKKDDDGMTAGLFVAGTMLFLAFVVFHTMTWWLLLVAIVLWALVDSVSGPGEEAKKKTKTRRR